MVIKAGRPSKNKPSATISEIKKSGKTRLNVDVSKELYKNVRIKALEDEMTVTDLVKTALHEYLSK